MKKKKIANLIMVGIILVIVASGVLCAGYIKGWFDSEDDGAVLTEQLGIITLERNGVAYTVNEDTVLRADDRISCDTGAVVKIKLAEGYLTMGQNAAIVVEDPDPNNPLINVENGEVFINAEKSVNMGFAEEALTFSDTVATLSVRKGACSISIYYGKVSDASAGEMIEWLGEERSVREFSINSLNDFNISELKKLNSEKKLIFTLEMLDELLAQRKAEIYGTNESEESESTEETTTIIETEAVEETEETLEASVETEKIEEIEEESSESEKTTQSAKPSETSKPKETQKATEAPEADEPQIKGSCTITISCDTILNNMENLDAAKAPYVPSDGCILPMLTVDFYEGETVFEVLNRACKQYNIQIEYSWTPLYNSYYIEGINNLYEFDCGSESGWMYKVNGWFPNYGCSSYYLSGGEQIVWCYTCVGLGEDVGADGW